MPMHKEYRDIWISAGYTRGMGSAEVLMPPSAEFIRVYHFTSQEYALSNLALRRLKVAKFSELNDPFELLAANAKNQKSRKAALQHKEEFSRANGLLCFSENWVNPLLWAHYASKHTGICLGFDVPRQSLIKVSYVNERESFDFGNASAGQIRNEVKDMLVRTKFDHWRYEEEQRLILPLGNLHNEGAIYFRPMDSELKLVEVVLGSLCGLDLNAVRAFVDKSYQNVRVFKSRPAYGGFNIVPFEPSVNW